MPFYEYQCSHCAHFFEALQKISEAPLRKCPACGKNTLKKLVSAPVFRLKGSGWYETDFKSDQDRKRNLAGAEQEPAGSSTGADNKAKGDADSAGKTESKPQAQGASETTSAKPADAAGERQGSAKPTPPSPNRRTSSRASPAGSDRTSARSGAARPAKRAGTAVRARTSSARARPTRKRR
ncbi:MAG TPA: FmdB family zinc ribbon protein [Steroidobacteraceae bacterium]|jgi:putative FmdB family regulatory protein|nr:FmdB family zinc ribbon protein [Steroidobacteraceae bacterium]